MFSNKEIFVNEFKKKIIQITGKSIDESTVADKYNALAGMVRNGLVQKIGVGRNTKYIKK